MKITIPKYIMGKEIEGSLERVLAVSQTSSPTPDSSQSKGSLPIHVKSDLSKYIQVGINGLYGTPALISPFELEGHNNMNYDDTHLKLHENGLYMPTPLIFMTHFKNVIDAHKGKRSLQYADGTNVSSSVVEDMYKHFTTNHKNVYGRKDVGAWTWLNGKFVESKGANGLDIEYLTEIRKGKHVDFIVKRERLETALMLDRYVDLSFTKQGFAAPSAESSNQSYKQGENIYFYYPRKDNVARFNAYSGRAYLVCDGYPADSGSSLGVFGCAEGASAQKIGGSS